SENRDGRTLSASPLLLHSEQHGCDHDIREVVRLSRCCRLEKRSGKQMRVAACDLHFRRWREECLQVELLSDVSVWRTRCNSAEHGAARAVECVTAARQPIRVIAGTRQNLR